MGKSCQRGGPPPLLPPGRPARTRPSNLHGCIHTPPYNNKTEHRKTYATYTASIERGARHTRGGKHRDNTCYVAMPGACGRNRGGSQKLDAAIKAGGLWCHLSAGGFKTSFMEGVLAAPATFNLLYINTLRADLDAGKQIKGVRNVLRSSPLAATANRAKLCVHQQGSEWQQCAFKRERPIGV